jgi:hypothetical protein
MNGLPVSSSLLGPIAGVLQTPQKYVAWIVASGPVAAFQIFQTVCMCQAARVLSRPFLFDGWQGYLAREGSALKRPKAQINTVAMFIVTTIFLADDAGRTSGRFGAFCFV